MATFQITTDTTADLPKDYLEQKGLGLLSLNYILNGVTYDKNHELPAGEFYDKMREGSMPTTSQVNPEMAREEFEVYLKQGLDVLHIAFSSGLSGSCNSSRIAAEELMEEYPERKIYVVDSLCASLGEGLLVYYAVKMQEAGSSIEEIRDWLEENKLHLCHMFTVNDLFHLHRGGRVSKATAIVGTLANIKPILHVDDEGHLQAISKARGRKKSLTRLVDAMEEKCRGYENEIIFISHGDCLEDAQYVADQIQERFGISAFLINYVGPTIGAHTGPGVVALFFMGSQR